MNKVHIIGSVLVINTERFLKLFDYVDFKFLLLWVQKFHKMHIIVKWISQEYTKNSDLNLYLRTKYYTNLYIKLTKVNNLFKKINTYMNVFNIPIR